MTAWDTNHRHGGTGPLAAPLANVYDAFMAGPSAVTVFGERAAPAESSSPPPSPPGVGDAEASRDAALSDQLEMYKSELRRANDDNSHLKREVTVLRLEMERRWAAWPVQPVVPGPAESYQRFCKANNVLIYNVGESPYVTDSAVVGDILYRMGLSSVPVLDAYRAVEPPDHFFVGPRPIVVTFANLADKIRVLATRRTLYGVFPWIRIGMDLTPCQRHQLRALQYQRNEMEAAGGGGGRRIKFVNGDFVLTDVYRGALPPQ